MMMYNEYKIPMDNWEWWNFLRGNSDFNTFLSSFKTEFLLSFSLTYAFFKKAEHNKVLADMLVHGRIYAREIINLLTLAFFSEKTAHNNNFF